jgi:hypothetical protein
MKIMERDKAHSEQVDIRKQQQELLKMTKL